MEYLGQWPREFEAAVEFRHPGWFEGGPEAERVWATMGELGIGSVISDTALRRDAVHMRMTAPFLLLRFGGTKATPLTGSAWPIGAIGWRSGTTRA